MTESSRQQLWTDFLAAWPPQRVRKMTLEEYTNSDKDDAFIYWIESRLDKLGSIWGGSAFKFGIYCRDNTEAKPPSRGRIWGDTYAWQSKFGKTEQEAFATIRARIIETLEAAQAGNFERVDEIDLAPVLKWKVAFLYQDQAHLGVFPIFKKDALFHHYKTIDPTAKRTATPHSVMYATLLERHGEDGNVVRVAKDLWAQWAASKDTAPRAWALPIGWLGDETVESLASKTRIDPEDIDSFLENLLSAADLSEGDHIVLLSGGDVRAVGALTSAEDGEYAWEQTPVDFPSGLLVNPKSEMRELDAAEWQEIQSHLPKPEVPVSGADEKPAPRYWKIAPGKNAVAWPEWKTRNIIAIGWPELGDLSAATKADFDKRAAVCAKEHGYKQGMSQVWTFRGIQPGDRVVANQGKHTALGIGTVASNYRFAPGTHTVDGEDYPHQMDVVWDDVTPRPVQEYGWQRTIVELSKEAFEALLAQQPTEAVQPKKPSPPPPPCDPQNIILYGPPGTGKTYSTVRRALELILGPEKLEGQGEKGLTALFREHQTRGQIEFVTFHQAYGYEEFVEGLRPVLDVADGQEVRYELHDGVFKRIALRAAAEGLMDQPETLAFDELWGALVAELAKEGTRTTTSATGKTYQLELSSHGNIVARPCEVDAEGNVESVGDKGQTASKENSRLYWDHRGELGPEPEKFTYEKTTQLFAKEKGGTGGNHYTALWIVYGQLLDLSRSAAARRQELVDKRARVQQALDRSTAGGASFSFSEANRQYVLIIDEINRGNVSRILGELITLLEPDKRLGARSELKLPLSYSPTHRFAVPPNLHVLGTMNTADRSIALMDVALRRRFTFEELMPSGQVIRDVLAKKVPDKPLIELVLDLFDTLNARIRFLYDRDHQLGHSYFLEVGSLDALRRVFVDRVVPLLQEYFYGAWDKISMVLGCPYDESGEPKRTGFIVTKDGARRTYVAPIVSATPFPEVRTLGFDHDEYEDRVDFAVMRNFQHGRLSQEALARTFLSVLQLEKDDFDSRLSSLVAAPETKPDDEAAELDESGEHAATEAVE